MDEIVYSHTFNMPGYYYYGVANGNAATGGVIKVKEGYYFDEAIDHYSLQIGDVIRWTWGNTTPYHPSYFTGFSANPGVSRSGTNHVDYTFLIPGHFSWFHSGLYHEYHFQVEDPDTGKHINIDWNSYTNMAINIEFGTLLFDFMLLTE